VVRSRNPRAIRVSSSRSGRLRRPRLKRKLSPRGRRAAAELAELLGVPLAEVEKELTDLLNDDKAVKKLVAFRKLVRFQRAKKASKDKK
jgi:hypothetical protein